jgi:hypothetical protein
MAWGGDRTRRLNGLHRTATTTDEDSHFFEGVPAAADADRELIVDSCAVTSDSPSERRRDGEHPPADASTSVHQSDDGVMMEQVKTANHEDDKSLPRR